MTLEEAVRSVGLTEQEARVELAVSLYAQGRISEGKAVELAGKNRWDFNDLLYDRGVPMNYDVDELEKDVATLKKQGRL